MESVPLFTVCASWMKQERASTHPLPRRWEVAVLQGSAVEALQQAAPAGCQSGSEKKARLQRQRQSLARLAPMAALRATAAEQAPLDHTNAALASRVRSQHRPNRCIFVVHWRATDEENTPSQKKKPVRG
eukprot:CAMPEP_0204437474 /NCGR_PEP_ID=MMETSP0470-20130426/77452_1 /ASSEMBLY_ACC=CAM_ASM_000385 /TAXON_ID=2969 /ORGANISM="Oxyrrhis marina" /LENGTH=129 /DNA_ID=CAMNT_0051436205 /DNA_START=213 /DNA_END=603 /DNA_ORIENTATION=-